MQKQITVKWSGRLDDIAGIKQYEIEMYKLDIYDQKLGLRTQSALETHTVPASISQQTFNFTQPGEYYKHIMIIYFMYRN